MSSLRRCCCLFILIQILTDIGITSKFVCPGDSVQLFQISNLDSCNADVYLYVHGDILTLIATWILRNCTLNSSLLPEYKNKVHFNTNGTIMINDVHPWDEGKYMMKIGDAVPMTYEEEIYVMELPTTECLPTISQLENSLFVSLKHDVCGKPLATPYWRDCCGVSYSNESVLKFPQGKEACTCHACIVSPALQCARKSTSIDYCSEFIKGGTVSTPVPLETMDVKMVIDVTVGITLVVLLLLLIIIIRIILHCKRNAKTRQRYKESKQSVEVQGLLHSGETQTSTLTESDDKKIWKRFNESKQSNDKLRHRYKESKGSDPNPFTEQAFKMHQLSQNANMKEKAPVTGHCAFCKKKGAMFILPCEHFGGWYMPTCLKCGFSDGSCKQCKASERKYMEFETWTVLTDSARN